MFKSAIDSLVKGGSYPTNDDEFVALLKSKGFEMSELDSIVRSDGRSMILATAGAGKSTALSFIYAKDKLYGRLSPNWVSEESSNGSTGSPQGRSWVTTFLSSGAEDLQRNIDKTLADLELFQLSSVGTSFKTIHSEFLELLGAVSKNVSFTDRSHKNYVGILDGAEMYGLEERIFDKLFRDFELGTSSRFISPQERKILKSIISRYRNTVISDYEFGEAEDDAKQINLRLTALPELVDKYQKLKSNNQVIDYDDMLFMVYDLFCQPNDPRKKKYYDFYIKRYNYLLLDEAQDMSELQYLALKPLFENCERVVLVGDPDQSIYDFRGANPEVMSWFDRDFKPDIYPLSVSYRCPTNIMEPMSRVIKYNSGRYDTTPRSFKEGGICEAYKFNSIYDMVEATLSMIDKCLAENKTVTVLSRVNFTYSPASIAYTIKRGISFNLLGDVRTFQTASYKNVWSLIEMVRGRGIQSLKNNLKVLDPDITNWDAKRVSQEFMNVIPKNSNVMLYLDVLSESLNSKSLYNLHEKFQALMSRSGGAVDEMEAFKLLLNHVAYYGQPRHVEVLDTIGMLVDESKTVDEFFQNMDFVDNAIRGAKNHANGVSPLTFATPFGFKGKESDVIINFDASDGVYPYMLSKAETLETERRIFFVAGTRAKKESYFFTREGKESPFLLESGIPLWYYEFGDGLSIVNNTKTLKERMEEQENMVGSIKGLTSDFSLDGWGL